MCQQQGGAGLTACFAAFPPSCSVHFIDFCSGIVLGRFKIASEEDAARTQGLSGNWFARRAAPKLVCAGLVAAPSPAPVLGLPGPVVEAGPWTLGIALHPSHCPCHSLILRMLFWSGALFPRAPVSFLAVCCP